MKNYRNMKFYNLMWHCPTSKKMGYKTKMKGTEILCPLTHTWLDYQKVRAKIDEFGHARLADDDVPDDFQEVPKNAIYDFYVQYNGIVMPYLDARVYLQEMADRFDDKLREIIYRLGSRYKNFIIEIPQ